jgi:hypothetical protein
MRKFLIVPALFFAIALSGCAGFDKSVFEGGLSLTAEVQNPITREQQAAVESSYQVAAAAALSYARLRRCGILERASATNLCSHWSVVEKLRSANRVAYKALVELRAFMDNNENVSAIKAFNEATAALKSFKSTAAATGI